MTKYALIQNGSVAEFREIDDIMEVAQHKKDIDGGPLLRPVFENKKPIYRYELAHLSTDITVDLDIVNISYTVIYFPHEQQQKVVKLEANRRILEQFPLWKQINMTVRSVELQDIWRRKGKWTKAEYAASDTITQAWTWIKEVRDASYAIEQLNPVPNDYDDDTRWPKFNY